MCGRRYHRVRGGPFPPSGRGVDGPPPDRVTQGVMTPEPSAPTFDPGLGGLIPELRWRGMFHAASDGLEARLATGRTITGYNGFDPSGALVPTRLEGRLSFPEFSYMLIQSADFQRLYRSIGCELQMGGADQWGNITAGLELIRRTSDARPDGAAHAFALAYPLLLNPSGAKFGKSETGDSVWLHADGTSPYAFYQHWRNTVDRDTSTYLRSFTT